RVSSMTGSFVEVLDRKTILVSPNNATKRVDYQVQVIKTIYPTYAATAQEISGLVTMLRSTLLMKYLAVSTDGNAIVMRDTSGMIAAAEKLIGEVDRPNASQPIAFDGFGNLFAPEGTSVRKSSTARSRLQSGATRPISINMNEDSRDIFEALAGMAGVNIIFDADFRSSGPIRLNWKMSMCSMRSTTSEWRRERSGKPSTAPRSWSLPTIRQSSAI